MIADITCEKQDMLLVNYKSPDGAKRHNRLWNGGNGNVRREDEGKVVRLQSADEELVALAEEMAEGPLDSAAGSLAWYGCRRIPPPTPLSE